MDIIPVYSAPLPVSQPFLSQLLHGFLEVFHRCCRLARSRLGADPLLTLGPRPGQAQHQYDNWYFGDYVGLQFPPGRYHPRPLTQSAMSAFESCTTLSDSLTGELTGELLLYT